ncbi:MAG: DUF429 domain-containing protein [Saprospiraceae bacterium]|nr:DUF429 domain-containing protein [Saprospiraceae bacterium]MDZ4702578.1 DUF429 domain-containing protein [Saprospiraceae bacterium]
MSQPHISDIENQMIAGIDYGAKLAGTTAVAWIQDGSLQFVSSSKGKDADAFLLSWAKEYQPARLFLDAPLSLPGKYRGLADCDDYFYRLADKELHAMSPMFLGGLTARAMKLTACLQAEGAEVIETYPGHLARLLDLAALGYKKNKANLPTVAAALSRLLSCTIPDLPDWHHIDAVLALLSGSRHQQGIAHTFGRVEEGVIVV